MNGGDFEVAVSLAMGHLLLGVALGWWFKGRRGKPCCAGRLPADELLARVRELTLENGPEPAALAASSTAQRSLARGSEAPDAAILNIVRRLAGTRRATNAQLTSGDGRPHGQSPPGGVHPADARIDPLTELANRRAFVDELAKRYVELQIARCDFSLLVVDVDHFKHFNETYGHAMGDQVLRAVAWTLKTTMRRMDVVARHGGEEFAVILPATNLEMASQAAERLRKAVEAARWEIEGLQLKATVSIGVSQAVGDDDSGALVGRADLALQAAKQDGRNCSYRHDGQTCMPLIEIAAKPAAAMPAEHHACGKAAPVISGAPLEASMTSSAM
jgi:diguanylate cyclase (GGDEF)-like protein